MSVILRCMKCSGVLEQHNVADTSNLECRSFLWCPNCKCEIKNEPKPTLPESEAGDKATDESMVLAFENEIEKVIDRYAKETNLKKAEAIGVLMMKVHELLAMKPTP